MAGGVLFMCFAAPYGAARSAAAAAAVVILGVAAAAAVAAPAAVAAAAPNDDQQNDNPAASTIILETHNLQSPLCQIFLKQTVFCLFHSTLYATNEIV